MAIGGVILVLAWVPGIKIEQFEPFGFDFTNARGSLLSVWWLLAGILGYYFVRFCIDFWVDYLEWEPRGKKEILKWWNAKKKIRKEKNTGRYGHRGGRYNYSNAS